MPTETRISTLFQRNGRDRDQIIADLNGNPRFKSEYKRLTNDLRARLVDFLGGTKTLPLTYDPFFKKMFNPDVHPERLEGFISSILGRKVKIKGVLSQEESLLQGTSLLIMDIIVELEDGSIANVEIQKISYLFPGQRMSCYSADLLLRQYTRVRSQKGAAFTYSDLKKVYTIVIFENSPAELKKDSVKDTYVHYGSTQFNSGAKFDLLQDYYVISLDVFAKNYYSKDKKQLNDLNGWLALLSTDRVDRLDELVSDYPQMESICRDMASYLDKPEEVIGMFSDALRILDENTVHYMMDEMQKQIDEKAQQLEDKVQQLDKKNQQLDETSQRLDETSQRLDETSQMLDETSQMLDETSQMLDESLKELNINKEQLADTNRQLDDATRQLDDTTRQLGDANRQLDDANKQLGDTTRQLDDANKQLGDTTRQLDDANKEIARLRELLASK